MLEIYPLKLKVFGPILALTLFFLWRPRILFFFPLISIPANCDAASASAPASSLAPNFESRTKENIFFFSSQSLFCLKNGLQTDVNIGVVVVHVVVGFVVAVGVVHAVGGVGVVVHVVVVVVVVGGGGGGGGMARSWLRGS